MRRRKKVTDKPTSEEINETLYVAVDVCDKKATIAQLRKKLREIGWWPPSKVRHKGDTK